MMLGAYFSDLKKVVPQSWAGQASSENESVESDQVENAKIVYSALKNRCWRKAIRDTLICAIGLVALGVLAALVTTFFALYGSALPVMISFGVGMPLAVMGTLAFLTAIMCRLTHATTPLRKEQFRLKKFGEMVDKEEAFLRSWGQSEQGASSLREAYHAVMGSESDSL